MHRHENGERILDGRKSELRDEKLKRRVFCVRNDMFDGSNVSVGRTVDEGRCYSSFFEIGIILCFG